MNPMVLDLSHHNIVTSFDQVRDFGVRGIIHKATQGASYADPTYASRRDAAAKAGLLWGAYHFGEAGDGEQQAKRFLSVARPDDSMLLALDFEAYGAKEMSVSEAQAFLETIEQEIGRKAVLYTGYSMVANRMGSSAEYFGSHRLWLAAYSQHPRTPAPWTSPWLWQYSDGRVNNAAQIDVPGISGREDMNSFAGSEEQLAAEWADGPSSDAAQVRIPATLSERDRVKLLQQELASGGFYQGNIDGIPGRLTIMAVQKRAGFTGRDVDGVVGPMTKPVLDASLAEVA